VGDREVLQILTADIRTTEELRERIEDREEESAINSAAPLSGISKDW
jgi:hypothetical protein